MEILVRSRVVDLFASRYGICVDRISSSASSPRVNLAFGAQL